MSNETTTTGTKRACGGGKFLSFFIKQEEYGFEILKVQEIIGMLPITPVPKAPDSIKGIINLRGKIIPVIDLRLKFNMDEREPTSETCIIVVQTSGVEVGVVVDKVSEVMDIADAEIEDVPAFGSEVGTDYLLGIGNTNGRVRLLLDIDKIISSGDVSGFQNPSGEAVAV